MALGAEVEVPPLDGKGKLRVPAGTQPGAILRIASVKGMPKRAGIGRGDQRVEVARRKADERSRHASAN